MHLALSGVYKRSYASSSSKAFPNVCRPHKSGGVAESVQHLFVFACWLICVPIVFDVVVAGLCHVGVRAELPA